VGIVTRDRAKILVKAVTSALSQRGANIQVAVLDDGSRDETDNLRARFPQVTWIRREVSDGYMSARNELMTQVGFEYFVSLDDDASFVQGDEIEVAVDYLENNKSVAAVTFDILSHDRPNPVPRGERRPRAAFVGCGHVLRLAPIRLVGVYETTPGSWGGEEKDLSLRLMDAGYEIVLLQGVHVWHEKTPFAREFPAQYRSSVCNDLVMTLRRTPTLLVPPALCLKFYQHLMFAWKRGKTRSCWQGFALFVRFMPRVMQSRHPVKFATLCAFMRLAGREP
jgi:GT2 family glycosyltransferase